MKIIFVTGDFGTKYISKIVLRDWDFILSLTDSRPVFQN